MSAICGYNVLSLSYCLIYLFLVYLFVYLLIYLCFLPSRALDSFSPVLSLARSLAHRLSPRPPLLLDTVLCSELEQPLSTLQPSPLARLVPKQTLSITASAHSLPTNIAAFQVYKAHI